MKIIKLSFLFIIFTLSVFGGGGVSKIFAHREHAHNSNYQIDNQNYHWGEGDNIIIDGFEYNGHRYNYVSESPIIKIRRSDNNNSSGEPCGLFAEKTNENDAYRLNPSFPENCDMAKVMGGRIINMGALDLFKNGKDTYDTPKNIERVDFISPNGIIAPNNTNYLNKSGHVVTEKSGNNEIKIATILSLDDNGDPSSYGPIVTVHDENGDAGSRKVDYGNTYIYLDDNLTIGLQKLGFYRDEKYSTQTHKPKHVGDSSEKLDMAFVSLKDLGIQAGQKYYGFSYFSSDVYDSTNLVDYNSFPKNTPISSLHHTDTADPYGGVAGFFVDAELGYGTCYGMIDNGTSIYEMDLSSNNMFKEIKIDTKFLGEGTAYRSTNHTLYAFQSYKEKNSTEVEKHGKSSTLFSIDLNSTDNPIIAHKEKDNIIDYEVEGAEFYYDPISKKEILYIISSNDEEKDKYYLHAFYADHWDKELSGYPKTIKNYKLDSLAIDPNTGEAYGIDDSGSGSTSRAKVYKIDLTTGVATFLFEASNNFDAEGLAYAIDGKLYTEDEGHYSHLPRRIYRVDLAQQKFIETRKLPGARDIEGLSCDGMPPAPIKKYDFGDAPDTYNHVKHKISSNLYLGDMVPDSENNQQSSNDASGDGDDDSDGVITLSTLSVGDTSFTIPVKVFNNTKSDAYITAWIDFNRNGKFEFREALNTNDLKVHSSNSSQTVNITWDNNFSSNQFSNLTAGQNIMRIRLSTSRILRSDSEHYSNHDGNHSDNYLVSPDGEVEDYVIKIKNKEIKGRFNIERTDSINYPLMSDKRNAWYTQIVGRDFNYSVVFYNEDFSAEQNLSDVTIKIDLIDMDTNTSLYSYVDYISNIFVGSRKNFTLFNDLYLVPATKNARFRVTYGVDKAGNIIHGNCAKNPSLCSIYQKDYAFDNFAIRPDYFHIRLFDGNGSRRVNTTPNNNTPLRVSAGYNYNLSITASIFNSNNATPAKDYNTSEVSRVLEFLDKSNNYAPIKNDYNSTDSFINGKNINNLFEIKEVGNYRLNIIDSNWTKVDRDKGDCDITSSTHSANGNIKSGCNISSPDINLSSYPDHFDINLNIQNLPNSTHNDFIYMSEINSTYNSVAIAYQGSIVAKNEDNETTQNFTNGYFAQDVAVELNASTLSDKGVNKNLSSNFARTVEFNSDGNITTKLNHKLSNLSIINISSKQFTNEHNGTVNIDIRYNIDKNISKTINPIQITFHNFKAKSINSSSISHGKEENSPYIPNGNLNLGDIVRNFYYAKVTPDRFNYPKVYTKISRIIRTPLSIDIFCDVNSSYCAKTGVLNNTLLTGTTREQTGWYISINHNGDIDGNVTKLIDNPSGTVILNPNPTSTTPLSFPNGHNGMESVKFINCNNKKVEITIISDPVLAYENNKYILSCTDNKPSEWSGVGKTGNILEVKPKVHRNRKMDW